MRAHFASDNPTLMDNVDAIQQQDISNTTKESQPSLTAIESQSLLHDRILEFKSDSSKMAVVGEFIDDVIQKAEQEANKQQNNKIKNSQQGKNKTQKQNLKNGKVVNKARGFVVKLFESICNCANNAATAPVTRFKFRSGKRSSSSADGIENNGKLDNNKKEEKSKKNSNNGKKSDKIKSDEIVEDKGNEVQDPIELQ